MKFMIGLYCMILLIHQRATQAKPLDGARRCVNMWDEGCINGQLPGAGGDDDYLNGGFNPGKRCLDVWDEGCSNGHLTGDDDSYPAGRMTPERHFLYELLARLQKKQHAY